MKYFLFLISARLCGMLLHSVDPVVVMKLDLCLVLQSGLYLVVGLIILHDFDTLSIVSVLIR